MYGRGYLAAAGTNHLHSSADAAGRYVQRAVQVALADATTAGIRGEPRAGAARVVCPATALVSLADWRRASTPAPGYRRATATADAGAHGCRRVALLPGNRERGEYRHLPAPWLPGRRRGCR